MAHSIHIPGLVDVKVVDDKADIRTLSLDRRIDRRFEPRGALINRLIVGRIRRTFQLDGHRLPAVSPRDDAERAALQNGLFRRFDPGSGAQFWDEPTLNALAAAVRGESGAMAIGPAAQQACGRPFVADYVADAASWRAACDFSDAVRSRNPLRMLRLRLGGRVESARRLLSERAHGDRACVHATGIAVHNLARGFEAMRDIYRRGAPRPTADEAVGRSLFPPDTVLRQATTAGGTLAGMVRPGTLLVYALGKASARAPGSDTVFMTGTWAACPAASFVPALLRAVWERAIAGKPAEGAP